jgi:hypothetical protein
MQLCCPAVPKSRQGALSGFFTALWQLVCERSYSRLSSCNTAITLWVDQTPLQF